jgi:hypothetical protein
MTSVSFDQVEDLSQLGTPLNSGVIGEATGVDTMAAPRIEEHRSGPDAAFAHFGNLPLVAPNYVRRDLWTCWVEAVEISARRTSHQPIREGSR